MDMNRTISINPDVISTSTIATVSNMNHHSIEVMSEPSSPESTFDENDLFHSAMSDDVTAQLAAAGPIGVAAAAAIVSGRKRKRPHSFETNPSIRKRQQTRLLRKLKATIDEYTVRVGQQAVILSCTPGKSNVGSSSYKVFGSQPLGNIIKNCKTIIMQELDAQLAAQAPQVVPERENLHELPQLNIDGIPTPIDKMTQAQLRAFIPEMLKYSTGRSKPGWGKHEYRPVWWPEDVPWANVRSDVRTEEMKKKVGWTTALRTIVRNCYHHHGRMDLLPEFAEDNQQVHNRQYAQQTMLQTISNPDGSLSIIQVETGEQGTPQIVTLADGSQAQIVHAQALVPGLHTVHQGGQVVDQVTTVRTLAEQHHQPTVISSVDISNLHQNQHVQPTLGGYTEATLNQDGQIVLTGDTSGLSGVVSIPVSMYQTVVTNLQNPGIQVINAANLQQTAQFTLPTNHHKQEESAEDSTNENSSIEVVTIENSQNLIVEDEHSQNSDT